MSTNSQPYISIRGLSHTYGRGNVRVFENVTLDVFEGERLVLLGPSGGGKSTLLRCINRLVKPTSGSVNVLGVDMAIAPLREARKVRRQIGMVFQGFNLIDRISVLDNVLIGRLGHLSTVRSITGFYRKEDIAVAMQALERVELAKHAQQLAMNLSGGQRQRVALARALAQQPRILLADEPVSNLDPLLQRDMMSLLRSVCEDESITSITSVHDVDLALEFSTRIVGVRDQNVTPIQQRQMSHEELKALYGT